MRGLPDFCIACPFWALGELNILFTIPTEDGVNGIGMKVTTHLALPSYAT